MSPLIKLLIIQNKILHYRKPVYNELSKYYDVTVLHSGNKSAGINDTYKEIIMPTLNIGSFIIQSGVFSSVLYGSYDVVIAMSDLHWINNMIVPFFSKKKRLLLWGHRYSNNCIIDKIKDIIMMAADGVILYSESEVTKMNERGILLSNIFVAPNTIYVPNHADGSTSPKDSFLFSGRAQKRKNVDVLIKAFAEVCDKIPKTIKINIVGSGTENEMLKVLARQLGLSDRVVFHGEITDHEILKDIFHRAYAYVSPGPVGLGVLHSFAYGVPVVTDYTCWQGPEFDNLADGENSILFGSYDEFKEVLVSLCKDETLSARLGNNAYNLYARERTIERMVEGFRQAIEGKADR